MSRRILLQCSNCHKIISKIALASFTKWTPSGKPFSCKYCGTKQVYENSFQATFNEVYEIISDSSSPLKEAEKILHGLEAVKMGKRVNDLGEFYQSKSFRKWLPNSPEKIAAYIAIITAIIMMLKQHPEPKIDMDVFINIFNETSITTINKDKNNR